MIRADIDPSLCAGEPLLDTLDDGFSPRAAHGFLSRTMNTSHSPTHHPVEPEPFPPGSDTPSPNPTQLPIEPEFGQALPPAEPEDPGVQKPTI